MTEEPKTAPATLTRFKMGVDIPEWLLTLSPAKPGAIKGEFRFGEDVDVFETADYFLVFPLMTRPGAPRVIDDTGCSGCRIDAASKPVWTVHGMGLTFPPEVDATAWAKAHGWENPVKRPR